MKKLNTVGFSAIIVLIAAVVLGVVGFAGWSIYASQGNSDTVDSKNNALPVTQDESDSEPETLAFLKKGTFEGIGAKTGSGSVTLERDINGQSIVQLEEDFVVQSGPALFVSFGNGGSVDHDTLFAELKSFSGKQEYVVPSSVDVDKYSDIIIYCEEFSVAFSAASLELVTDL